MSDDNPQHEHAHELAQYLIDDILAYVRDQRDVTPHAMLLATEIVVMAMRGFVAINMGIPQPLLIETALQAIGCSRKFYDELCREEDLLLAYQRKLEEEHIGPLMRINVPGGDA